MQKPDSYFKRGYLDSELRLFHLTDIGRQEFEFHYHDFDKILIFLSGKVTYLIEGRSYELQPYDIIFVRHNEIHRPLIDMTVPYERLIAYLDPDFLESQQDPECSLSDCFQVLSDQHTHLLRMEDPGRRSLFQAIKRLEAACKDTGYASRLYRKVLFLEFMILLNRTARSQKLNYPDTVLANQKILDVMDYINRNLAEPLDIDTIASHFFFSRYHLMRLFKKETGYTLGRYITSKRLLAARELLQQDLSATEICYRCGFCNYSAFSRAYRAEFGESPRVTRSRMLGSLTPSSGTQPQSP